MAVAAEGAMVVSSCDVVSLLKSTMKVDGCLASGALAMDFFENSDLVTMPGVLQLGSFFWVVIYQNSIITMYYHPQSTNISFIPYKLLKRLHTYVMCLIIMHQCINQETQEKILPVSW